MMLSMTDDSLATLGPGTGAPDTPPERRPADGSGPAAAPEPARAPAVRRGLPFLMVAGLALAALNLRPAITSLGPLMEEVRSGLGMSATVAGLLTSVPALCFAVFGTAAPRLARRFGPGAVVCAGMAAIAIGVVVRPYTGSTAGFLAATALALAGIAVSNVLLPVVIKTWFPDRVGPLTGLYSMALALGSALAAALTVPVTTVLSGSWQSGLAVWAVLAVLAVLPWLTVVRGRRAADGTGARGPAVPAATLRVSTSPTAWALAVFFGLQATAAYITMGWMAQIFRDAGVPAGTAGVLLAVTMAIGIPLSFVLPRVAARMRNQGPLAVGLGLCGLAGYAGLWLAPASGAWLWTLLMGISNCSFPLALTMIGMRSRSAEGVVRLSAFVQSVGYLISIPGPLLVAALYQHSGGWGLPIALMAGLMVPQMAVGMLAGRDRRMEDEAEVRH
ncbi:MFS transporter [Streptomyces chrestomyceticus JCM 4735]|uniref:MFS transporter n=2 Tax=Streptomyces chrestomyceticus TaxID=68185 RepID=A0A7U9Q1A8_9ACTN|nr:MFS transporter [Streptomyces chrestomyceticus JCM 4735]